MAISPTYPRGQEGVSDYNRLLPAFAAARGRRGAREHPVVTEDETKVIFGRYIHTYISAYHPELYHVQI
jgi:hypothetical protein